jgi:hypothetical protein
MLDDDHQPSKDATLTDSATTGGISQARVLAWISIRGGWRESVRSRVQGFELPVDSRPQFQLVSIDTATD